MALSWEVSVARSLERNMIRELYLYQIPVLKTCDNWLAVTEVGRIDFRGKHTDYRGALVRYMQKLYFVPDNRLKALSDFRKWNLKNRITVINDEEYSKANPH